MRLYRVELVWPGTFFSSIIVRIFQADNWTQAYALAQFNAGLWYEDVKVLNVRRLYP